MKATGFIQWITSKIEEGVEYQEALTLAVFSREGFGNFYILKFFCILLRAIAHYSTPRLADQNICQSDQQDMLSVRSHSKVALGRFRSHGHPQSVFQNNSVLPDRVVNTMANSPICRTQIITISIFNEVVVVLLVVLVDAKSHHVAAL